MRVTKPISSISYNSVDFLKSKLDFCLKLGLISFALIQRNLDDKAEREYQKQLEERESKIDKAIDKILNDKEN